MAKPRPLKMKFAGEVVRHLGLQMYAGPVPAIAELISNAWDANAEKVKINITFGKKISTTSMIEVEDNGHGMEWSDCDSKYMVIGRDARKEDGNYTQGKFKRKRMAHKGLGKLAGFGIANTVEIITVKNKKRTKFVLDYSVIEKLEHGEDYEILPEEDNVATSDNDGTKVILRNLKLRNAIVEDIFMRSMARRFSVLSDKFQVQINDKILKKDEGPFQIYFPNNRMKFDKEKIIKKKGVFQIPGAGTVTFWIGFTEKPIHDAESRGIAVLSRGKLVQEPWFFDVTGGVYGQHGMQYMTGEVEADFLDDKTDFVTTGRNTILWSMKIPALLKEWGKAKVVAVLSKWADERGKIKIEHIQRATPYLERIQKFPKRQRKELTAVMTKMASIETIEDDRLIELVRSLINAYENKELTHMIDEVSALSPDAQSKLYEILQEFQILESVSIAQIVKSHIKIIEKFEEMIDKGVPEKPNMQEYLKDYPWLIDPTYMGLSHEKRLETILKEKFHKKTKAKGKNKRIDFFCLGELGRAFVIEVKRPKEKIGRAEIQQLTTYIDFLRQENSKISNLENKKTFFGYLIGTNYSEDAKGEMDRAHRDGIYTKTWDTLLETARKSHQEFFNAMRKKVPPDDPRLENFSNE